MSDETEQSSLPVHVALCGERYRSIHKRLGRIEWAIYLAVAGALGIAGWVIKFLLGLAEKFMTAGYIPPGI